MDAIKQWHPEDVQGAVGKIKIADAAMSEKRKELISAYAKLPGGPAGVKIADEKAFKEFKEKSTRPWVQDVLKEVKQNADEYGVVPLKWFFDSTKNYNISHDTATNFLLEAQRAGALAKDPFQPNNKEELNFFIGEAAYYSRIFVKYPTSFRIAKDFYNALKSSGSTVKVDDLRDWYNKEGAALIELKFSGEQRALLLGYGLTAEWKEKLHLSKEEAVEIAKEYPTVWREKTKKRILYS